MTYRKLWLLALVVLPFGCKGQDARSAYTFVDSWYRAPKNQDNFYQSVKIKFHEVPKATEANAEKMLRVKPIVALSVIEARRLMTGKYRSSTKMPYLVRAVYLNRETGAFSVYKNGNDLFVSHGSLGHSAVPMKRQTLIVDLFKSPKNVYVDCSMIE